MSKIPLRTSELWEASNKPRTSENTRQSRSSNFLRSTSTSNLVRHKSTDRLASTNSKQLITNSAIKKRSLSASTTPRTPNYPITMTNFLTTAERAETFNKKWIHTETINILEYLKLYKSQFDSNFFQKNNPLKSMSTKQFIQILNLFLQKLCGSKFKVTSDPDNIIKVLNEIDYPYQVTKSWLKTPCALHAHTNVIQLLSWLRFFVDVDSTDCFVKGTFKILEAPIEAFSAWNNCQETEYEHIKEKLCNEYLQEHYQIENIKAFNEDIALLDMDIQKLEQNEPIHNKENELLQIENDFKKIEQSGLTLEANCKLDDKKFNELNIQVTNKKQSIEVIKKNISELKQILESQSMSREEHLNLTKKIHLLSTDLEINNDKNTELQNNNYKKQVLQSRLIQQKNEILMKYNGLINNILPYQEIKERDYIINKDTKPSKLEKVQKFWTDINLKLIKEANLKQDELKSLDHKLELLQHHYNIKNDYLKDITKQVNEKQELLLAQEKELLNICNLNAKNHNNKVVIFNELHLSNEKFLNKTKVRNEVRRVMEKENQNKWNAVKKATDETIKEKEKKLEEYNKFCDELDSYIKKQKNKRRDP